MSVKFALIGAGAVGGYFGSKLKLSGEDVTFLVRSRRHTELEKHGLHIQTAEGEFQLKVRSVTESGTLGRCDCVIVAVKNFDLGSVIETVGYLGSQGAKILSLMNGVEQFEKIRSVVPDRQIVGGVCHLESTLENGVIMQKGIEPSVILGSPSPEGQDSARLVGEMFRKAGVNTNLSEDIVIEVWRKFIFINLLSSLTCLAHCPIGPILENTNSQELFVGLMQEVMSFAAKINSRLSSLSSREITQQIKHLPYNMTSSMERDLEMGRPLEVENIQGYVVRKAKELRLPIPFTNVSYDVLKLREHGPIKTV